MPRSPTSSPIFESPTDIATSWAIPKIITDTKAGGQSPSEKTNIKSPLTTNSKSRTGIPIIIETNCDFEYSRLGVTGQSGGKPASIDIPARSPSLEDSDRFHLEVGAELDDEDYLVDEYRHAGHKSAQSFTGAVVYSKSSPTLYSPGSGINSQASPAEQCLMRKGFRVEVREYDTEKAEDSEQGDEVLDEGCCGCLGWFTAFWRR
ncbi:uncharacterized protein DFL_009265 [Arthrobotrys flagrans]|uniref:Uncharacterized protein n=1 Tax=Arthrobotrys flagrans TaxID=97331 RepID=A0A436ZR62_ARTFL|nr:hypothetical protein DFL_009265 [Arthrobotrys flagrans]